ncbi:TadA family conjugal transfer-associated ATPase [Nakamurella sp. UYEF19]|uniref:TadA family conjugal transfer-associated ATPase n=1 Tax=Nakamurella sp. UYEF19 TaxID=1756392 RepID=UPI00339965E2
MIESVQRRLADERSEPSGAALARAVRAETSMLVTDAEMLNLIKGLQRELVGAGPLAEILADPSTTDVVVNAPDDVRVDRGAGWERLAVTFPDEAAVQRLARRLATSAGQRLDEAQPFVDARLSDGTRLHAVIAPVAASGTCLSLRVLRPTRHDLAALTLAGTLPGICRPVLEVILRARLAFLISGGTGSGKTTLLAALLGAIHPSERLVTVEDAEELRPDHPHLVRLVARAPNVEGAGAIGMRQLVRQALRMCPDRIVVGEVRGVEVVELLTALNTGHDGGAGTVHANAASEVPARMEALAAPAGLGRDALHAQLGSAVQLVLHMRRVGGRRVLSEIAVLSRDPAGLVVSVPAVVDGRPVTPGAGMLSALASARGVEPTW